MNNPIDSRHKHFPGVFWHKQVTPLGQGAPLDKLLADDTHQLQQGAKQHADWIKSLHTKVHSYLDDLLSQTNQQCQRHLMTEQQGRLFVKISDQFHTNLKLMQTGDMQPQNLTEFCQALFLNFGEFYKEIHSSHSSENQIVYSLMRKMVNDLAAYIVEEYITYRAERGSSTIEQRLNINQTKFAKHLTETFFQTAMPGLSRGLIESFAGASKEVAAAISLKVSKSLKIKNKDSIRELQNQIIPASPKRATPPAFISRSASAAKIANGSSDALLDVDRIKKKRKQLEKLLKEYQAKEILTPDLLNFYLSEIERLQEQIKHIPIDQIQKATEDSVLKLNISIAALSIMKEHVHALMPFLERSKSLPKEVANQTNQYIGETFDSIQRGFDEVEELLDTDHVHSPAFYHEITSQLEKNFEKSHDCIDCVTDVLHTSDVNSMVEMLAQAMPFASLGGSLLMIGVYSIRAKHSIADRKDLLHYKDKICKRAALSRSLFVSPEATSVFSEAIGQHKVDRPTLHLEKSIKSELLEKNKELQSTFSKAKTLLELQTVAAKVQEQKAKSGALLKLVSKRIQTVEKEIEELIAHKDEISEMDMELGLEQKQMELKAILKEGEALVLQSMRSKVFAESKQVAIRGMQLCILDYMNNADRVLPLTKDEIEDLMLGKTISQIKQSSIDWVSKQIQSIEQQGISPLDFTTKVTKHNPKGDKLDNIFSKLVKHNTLKEISEIQEFIIDWGNILAPQSANKALRDIFFEKLLLWNLEEIGLKQEHIDVLKKFKTTSTPETLARFDSIINSILSNKYKSNEKRLFYTNLNIASEFQQTGMSLSTTGLTAAHIAVLLGATAASVAPVTSPIMAVLGIALGASYLYSHHKLNTLEESSAEKHRKVSIFLETVNFIISDIHGLLPSTFSEKEIEILKESILLLAEIDDQEREAMCFEAAYLIDQLTPQQIESGMTGGVIL